MEVHLQNCTAAHYQTLRWTGNFSQLHFPGEGNCPSEEGNFPSSKFATILTFKYGGGGEGVTWPGKWWGYFYTWLKVYLPRNKPHRILLPCIFSSVSKPPLQGYSWTFISLTPRIPFKISFSWHAISQKLRGLYCRGLYRQCCISTSVLGSFLILHFELPTYLPSVIKVSLRKVNN